MRIAEAEKKSCLVYLGTRRPCPASSVYESNLKASTSTCAARARANFGCSDLKSRQQLCSAGNVSELQGSVELLVGLVRPVIEIFTSRLVSRRARSMK